MAIEHGGGGARTRIVCGFLGGQQLAGDPLFSSLPALIRYDCAAARSGALVQASMELAARETSTSRPGADAMLARISELLFVEAVRTHIESLETPPDGLYAALRDPPLSKALALIHRDPAKAWTVETLGRAVGASRSSLADRFKRHLGHAPAEYLTRHRMRLAARDLATGDARLVAIAQAAGYRSEAAFSRAFKRIYAVSPSAWRDAKRTAD